MSCGATTLWLVASCESALQLPAITPTSLTFAPALSAAAIFTGLLFIVFRKGESSQVSSERILLSASMCVAAAASQLFVSLQAANSACSHGLRLLVSVSRLLTSAAILSRVKELRPNSRTTESGTLLGICAGSIGLVLADIGGLSDVSAACTGHSATARLWMATTGIIQPLLLLGNAVRAAIVVFDGSDEAGDEHHNRFSALSLLIVIALQFCSSATLATSRLASLSLVPMLLLEICFSPVLQLASHVHLTMPLPKAGEKGTAKDVAIPRLRPHRRTPSTHVELPTVMIDHSAFGHAQSARQKPRLMRLSSVDGFTGSSRSFTDAPETPDVSPLVEEEMHEVE